MMKTKWLISILLILLLQQLFPLIQQILLHPDPIQLQHFFQSNNGIVVLFLLQAIQIFLFLIPAFPIQITASLVYGFYKGTLIIYVSYLLTNILLYYGTQKENILFSKLIKRYQFLSKHHFMIYLIPTIPNLIKPYITKINNYSFTQFLYTLSIASLPSILLSTLIGTCLKYQYYAYAILFAFLFLLFTISTYLYLFIKSKKR